jgi:hypothetical protein
MDELERRLRHVASSVGRQVATPEPAVIRRRSRRVVRRRVGGTFTLLVTIALGAVIVVSDLTATRQLPAGPVAVLGERPEPPPLPAPIQAEGTRPAAPGGQDHDRVPPTSAATSTFRPERPHRPAVVQPGPRPVRYVTVEVYFYRHGRDGGTCRPPEPLARRVRADAPARRALQQLLKGPTAAERADGWSSAFSGATAGSLRRWRVGGGRAHVDFADLDGLRLGPEGAPCRAARVLQPLRRTLLQFEHIRQVHFSIRGSEQRFRERLAQRSLE